jgi:hypothetical protein
MLEIHGKRGRLLAVLIDEDFDKRGVLRMWSMDAYDPVSRCSFWSAHNDLKRRTVSVWDERKRPRRYAKRPMTVSDIALCEFAEPRFGDCNELWRRVETYLKNEGFGTLRDNFER